MYGFLSQGDAPGSVPQPKIVFPPCSPDCDNKCLDTCPDYCCVKVLLTNKIGGESHPAPVPRPLEVITIIYVAFLSVLN